jgi:hypothetical protein
MQTDVESTPSSGGKSSATRSTGRPRLRAKRFFAVLGLIYLLPLFIAGCIHLFRGPQEHWSRADRSSAGLAPDPARTLEAVVQVYAARTYGWRGIFGLHTWFALKPAHATAWERFEVVGFGVNRGRPAVRIGPGVPDGRWYGNHPTLLGELRGVKAEAAIPLLRAAAADYPYQNRYTVWPGPNSNTFTAHLARRVPDLCVDLPANAIGKDYPVAGAFARTPSGTGWQFSLGGIIGIAVGFVEGIELNLLGLNAGVDFRRPALRLPGVGRLGMH